jgi:hypothetical protein
MSSDFLLTKEELSRKANPGLETHIRPGFAAKKQVDFFILV